LVGVTIYGVVGYRVVEGLEPAGRALHDRHHLATVGFGEVQPLDAKGQAFTSSPILAGVMALFVSLGAVTELVVSGQLARVLRRKRMDTRIGRLDQQTVICAYGRVGRAVAGGSCHRGASATPPQPCWFAGQHARRRPDPARHRRWSRGVESLPPPGGTPATRWRQPTDRDACHVAAGRRTAAGGQFLRTSGE
jgi:hypothetical protein